MIKGAKLEKLVEQLYSQSNIGTGKIFPPKFNSHFFLRISHGIC